ncbi:hypothetical protein [Paenibacillus sp. 1011MAR3C5]|uniref:hypothetical protein n=1 Tax=Paenibacillus sp. 1011MAR3C5 TaxID=1675787 RepID=UPI0015FEEB23|nr:hypothetical protein [Paenibacillus sp. 1011MAR3C5]
MASFMAFWKSDMMLKYPWAQPVVFAAAAIVLSFFTWFRKPRQDRSKDSDSEEL